MKSKRRVRTSKDFCAERASQGQRVGIINLGCARNLVDAQVILGNVQKQGHTIVDIKNSEVAILNTCAFIEEAKKESIDAIVDLVELKKQGRLKKIIVTGCLAQRYGPELIKEFKEIDAVIGAQKLDQRNVPEQILLTPGHTAYVKICESCYNCCSFCVIPAIKGKFVSRTMESVLKEVERLDAGGGKEINIIGQDITAYGMDIYHQKSLARLLQKIAAVTKNIQWIRLLYAFPAHVTDELIDVIAGEDKICKYLDIPLQHISGHLLKAMNRNMTTRQTMALIRKLRTRIPEASLRTTFIVGFPGETQEDFEELLRFVEETRFDKAGGFAYSREEGTPAFEWPDQVPENIKKKRLDKLMKVQRGISQSVQERFLGETLNVLIDEKSLEEKGLYIGRTEFDAPEVDGAVTVRSQKLLNPGDFVSVKIRDTYEYDLAGEAV
ncbi:MAG TPA: 30S ribosomal protein S12 methylthiotransferase RimO [Candidatus Omnitrophica bacterium]|nr:30S ribosomal protein S12 methylthiotransferase RimO [Candidatus Omnitrophota bacterium]